MLKRLLVDNALLALQYAASALVPLALIPHFVRTLGAEEYGKVAVAIAAVSYASLIVQYAFHLTAPAEFVSRGNAIARKVFFWEITVARVLLLVAVLAIIACGLLMVWLLGPAGAIASVGQWWMLLAFPVGAALHSGWHLQCTGRYAALAAISVAGAAVTLATGFTVVAAGEDQPTQWAAASLAVGPLVVGVGTFLWSAASLGYGPARVSWKSALDLLGRGRPVFLSQLLASGYGFAGPLVVAIAAGGRSAGLYSAIERIANAIQAVLGLTHAAAYPRLATLYKSARAEYLRLLGTVIGIKGAATVMLGVLLFFSSDAVSTFIFGEISSESLWLMYLAWIWLTVSLLGLPLTGYLTVSGSHAAVLPLTFQVLLVTLPTGAVGAMLLGGAGWLIGLIAGQCLVLARAIRAYRHERSRLIAHT
ncbi:MAG: oligosaccharide flippase family protein [Casimicrobiaceae bacterium]|nr:oligosaccharide flippase family protein [Casimicrobiaceae bacterium]